MDANRRNVLKGLATAGAVAAAGAAPVAARERKVAPADAKGLLYDTTKCIGCKTCVVACHEANGLSPDAANPETAGFNPGIYDAPTDLNATTKTVIKLYKGENEMSFYKAQCMHCVDPACVGACMIGSLQKREYGIVTWDPKRCIGCRYCQMVCPFDVPKFQWMSAAPKIVKCELCNHRIADGKQPACTEVCPRHAVIYGSREDLLTEAHRRLESEPGRYVPKVFGETDLGGTQVLVLSHVDFDKLGLPDYGDTPVPETAQTVQHGIYQGFVAPVALYGLLAAVLWRNRRREGAGEEGR